MNSSIPPNADSNIYLSLEQAHKLAKNCLIKHGCDAINAQAVADTLMQAEANQCYSHGLFRLPLYIKGLQVGRVNGSAKPQLAPLAPAVVQVDGDSGFAPLGLQKAHRPLVDCAKQNGIAALAFTNMFHIAALWPEVEKLAEAGLCAFAFTASYPYVAPAGGIKPLYGTNPMAFAWPRNNAPPLVFDQASAAMARGEIMLAARDGHRVPTTAGISVNGETTTDPETVLAGAQLGFGGYKGASLGLMIELIAGPLLGEFLSFESKEDDQNKGGSPKGGELILALNPAQFGDPDNFLAHGEKLFAAVLAQAGTRLPGQRRLKSRAHTAQNGIQLPKSLHATLLELS